MYGRPAPMSWAPVLGRMELSEGDQAWTARADPAVPSPRLSRRQLSTSALMGHLPSKGLAQSAASLPVTDPHRVPVPSQPWVGSLPPVPWQAHAAHRPHQHAPAWSCDDAAAHPPPHSVPFGRPFSGPWPASPSAPSSGFVPDLGQWDPSQRQFFPGRDVPGPQPCPHHVTPHHALMHSLPNVRASEDWPVQADRSGESEESQDSETETTVPVVPRLPARAKHAKKKKRYSYRTEYR